MCYPPKYTLTGPALCQVQVPWCIQLALKVVCSTLKSGLGSLETFGWTGHLLFNVCPAYFSDLVKSVFVCGWKTTISKCICHLDFLVWFRWGIQVFLNIPEVCCAVFPLVCDETALRCTVLHSFFLQYLRDICVPHFVHYDSSLQNLPTPPSPAFSGLCFSWWGSPGCGEAVSILQESSGWVLPSAALPNTGRLPGFGWGWDVPRVRVLYFVWSGLGHCPFGYTPPWVTAQNKHCANRESLKQAISENCCASTKIKTNQSGQWLQESVFAWSVF